MIQSILLVLLITAPALSADSCKTEIPTVTLYSTPNEQLIWDLQSIFSGKNLDYTISDSTNFKVFQPIAKTGADQAYKGQATIVSAKPNVKSTGAWSNSFIFLTQDATSVKLAFAQGAEGNMKDAPQFSDYIVVSPNRDNNLNCFDLEYSSSNDKYIVTCQTNTGTAQQNVIYLVQKDGTSTAMTPEAAFFESTASLLGSYTTPNQRGTTQKYLFRATPAYGIKTVDGKLSKDSIIEAFYIKQNGEPQNTGYLLDALTLALLLGEDTDFQFMLVDWRVMSNGDIYILDAQHGIFVVNFHPNGEWSVKERIATPVGQAFAFDINQYRKSDGQQVQTMVVLGYNFFVYFENGTSVRVYDLPYQKLDYPQWISITQEFVLTRDTTVMYMYDLENNSVEYFSKLTIENTNEFLVNPYSPDVVSLSQTASSRFTLSQGYLQYAGAAGEVPKTTVTLTAKSGQVECTSEISYQVVKDDDYGIYLLDENIQPFPKTVTEDTPPFQLNRLASGPNLQYQQAAATYGKFLSQVSSSVDVDIRTRWALDLSQTAQLPDAADVVYSDILVSSDSSEFYILLQVKDKAATVWKCAHPSIYDDKATCAKQCQFTGSNILDSRIFQMWQDENGQVYTAEMQSDFKIVISTVDEMKLTPQRTIQYDANVPSNKILSFVFLKDYIYVVQDGGSILAYSVDGAVDPVGEANQTTFVDDGFAGTWKPIRLFGNRKLKSNLVFIVNTDNIILADFHQEFSYITQFAYTAGAEVSIAIGADTFFIIEGKTDASKGKITEYDYEKLNNIFKTKDVQLYWYEIQSPINADFCSDTGFLFTRALCTKCDKTFLLAFRPDAPQHEALFQAWDLSGLVADGTSIQVASQGSDQMFLYINDGQKQTIWSILDKPVMLLKPTVNQEEYIANVDINLQLTNYDDVDPKTFKQSVKMINTQTKVTVDQKKFNGGKNDISLSKKTTTPVTQNLGTDWYSGQFPYLTIDCKQCNDKILIKNIIEKGDVSFNGYLVRDSYSHPDMNILQATNAILLTNADYTLKYPAINLDLPTETYQCFQAAPSPDGLYILSLCEDAGIYYLYATSCVSVSECHPIGQKVVLGEAAKIQLLSNEVIAVLFSDSSDPEGVDGTIQIHSIEIGQEEWTLTELLTISAGTFGATTFHPADFQITKYSDNKYNLLLTDATFGFYTYDFSLEGTTITAIGWDALDLYEFLNSDQAGQYALTTTQYYQFRYLSKPTYDQTSLTSEVFLQTNNVAHYAFKLTITDSKFVNTGIKFLLNRYGTWPSINKLAINQKSISIPYLNAGMVLIATYTIPTQLTLTPIIMKGGFYIQGSEKFTPFDFTLLYTNDQLLASDVDGVSTDSFNFNAEPSLIFTNPSIIEEQDVQIVPKSDFTTQPPTVKASVKIEDNPGPGPGPGPDPDPKPSDESSNLWWIILIIVGGVLVLGVGGFFFYKKMKKNNVDDDSRQALTA